jgi:hypothetical protein
MGKQIIFRLTEKRTPVSWTVSGGFAVKLGKGRKLINYYPGSDSYFVEDQTSDIPAQEVEFKYNDILSDPATEIMVDEDNISLVGYLKAHPFFNVHYYIHNEEQLSEDKLAAYDKVEKAFSLIKETEDVKVQAMALAVFKMEAYGWAAVKCLAELKEKAAKQPDVIINAIEADNYESKYLAALAFYSGIVSENNTHTAVVWCDADQNVILRLAVGENGIQKLGDKLSVSDEESNLLLQEIGNRVEKANAVTNIKVLAPQVVSGKTEAQIRAEVMAELKAKAVPVKTEAEIRAEIMAELAAKEPVSPTIQEAVVPVVKTDATFDETDLVQVQAKYKEVTGEDAPPRFKNDLKWLNTKIVEKEI